MTTQPDDAMPVVAYIGNFRPPHSTENHVAETLRRLGCTLVTLQEDDPATWQLTDMDDAHSGVLAGVWPDLVLWTRTGSLTPPADTSARMLASCMNVGVPTVGFHLDRWWGLGREGQIAEDPFFRCAHVITADGGHDDEWAAAGVNHTWMPPAVAEFEMGWGRFNPRVASDVAFVGSWERYHPEWPWRRQLIRLVQSRYGNRRFRCWPEPGAEAVRGRALQDLYASATVVIGDSCLVGRPERYWSDRIPETLGRGGLLVHPEVVGMDEEGFVNDQTLLTVEPESIDAVFAAIEWALAMPIGQRLEIQRAGMAMVADGHTYRHRMLDLFDMLALDYPR